MNDWYQRPAASSGIADEESGTEAKALTAAEKEKQLRALEVMHQRGLIPDDVFEARKAAIADAPLEVPDRDPGA